MAYAIDSKQAQAYLIDPMNAPEPSHETGPGAHFGSTFAGTSVSQVKQSPKHSPASSLSTNNPYRKDSPLQSPVTKDSSHTHVRQVSGGSERFPDYRAGAFGGTAGPRSASRDSHTPRLHSPVAEGSANTSRHRRTSSLQQRFPGDETNEPLKMLRRDSKKAYKSPHLRKHHIPGADTIDRLDPSIGGVAYHHEGPYDAALLARNTSFDSSPVAALATTNEEALKATPKENIDDAIQRHRPLEGTAQVPSGMPDRLGRVYTYEEGADLMREGVTDAGYKRWPGQVYHKDDLKGKGEPAYSQDLAAKAHQKADGEGIELEDRKSSAMGHSRSQSGGGSSTALGESNSVRRNSSLRAAGEGLKRRIGSLRHKKKDSS